MKPLLLALILSLSISAVAADGKSVSYKSGDETVTGLLYTPAGSGPFPATAWPFFSRLRMNDASSCCGVGAGDLRALRWRDVMRLGYARRA